MTEVFYKLILKCKLLIYKKRFLDSVPNNYMASIILLTLVI